MNPNSPVTVSHIGICSADVERSLRFYTQALGFEQGDSIDEVGPPFDELLELPGARCKVHYVKSGGLTLELVGFATGVVGSHERRPMNQLGFTHLTVLVTDIDSVAARVEAFGGRVHPETRIDSPYGPILFCTDPDGVRIELFQTAG